jgi:Lrp/AsnC family transcriptional regulator, leucine-responsive regulatory protein
MELDKQDLQILHILQLDTRTPIDRVAEEVCLSTASVQRRLKRLRDNNIIANEVAVVSPKAVGQSMTFIVSIELERDSLEHLTQFKTKIKKDPRIQQCYYVTGDSDFVLIVMAKDMESFDVFIQETLFDDRNVRHYKTSVVMERTKVSLALPLE